MIQEPVHRVGVNGLEVIHLEECIHQHLDVALTSKPCCATKRHSSGWNCSKCAVNG